MSSHSPVDPIYYKAGLWGARESFVYTFKSVLVSIALKIDFAKLDDVTGRLVADALVRVPLNKAFQFLCETEFKDLQACGLANRFEFYREKDLRKRSEKRIEFDGSRFCSFKNKIEETEGMDPTSVETPRIVNPLLLFLGLRTFVNQGSGEPITSLLVATSGRLYPVDLRMTDRDGALALTVPTGDSENKETRSLRVSWDKNLGVPERISLGVPVFGKIDLCLESSKIER